MPEKNREKAPPLVRRLAPGACRSRPCPGLASGRPGWCAGRRRRRRSVPAASWWRRLTLIWRRPAAGHLGELHLQLHLLVAAHLDQVGHLARRAAGRPRRRDPARARRRPRPTGRPDRRRPSTWMSSLGQQLLAAACAGTRGCGVTSQGQHQRLVLAVPQGEVGGAHALGGEQQLGRRDDLQVGHPRIGHRDADDLLRQHQQPVLSHLQLQAARGARPRGRCGSAARRVGRAPAAGARERRPSTSQSHTSHQPPTRTLPRVMASPWPRTCAPRSDRRAGSPPCPSRGPARGRLGDLVRPARRRAGAPRCSALGGSAARPGPAGALQQRRRVDAGGGHLAARRSSCAGSAAACPGWRPAPASRTARASPAGWPR